MRNFADYSRVLAALTVAVGLVLGGCMDLGFSEPPSHGTYLRIEPNSLTLAEGRMGTLQAKTDAEISDGVFGVRWYTSSSGRVSIDYNSPGTQASVYAYSPGTEYVFAEHIHFGQKDTIEVVVLPVTERSLEIEPDSATTTVGESVMIHSFVRDSVGVLLRRQLLWSSSDTSVVLLWWGVWDGVWAKGVQRGRALVEAKIGNLTASTVVEVR